MKGFKGFAALERLNKQFKRLRVEKLKRFKGFAALEGVIVSA